MLEVDDELLKYVVFRFILQPIIENAVYHGLEPKIEKGNLSIFASKTSDECIVFDVIDDGIGIDSEIVNNAAIHSDP